ncbi:MAG: ABC transporter C-terminal domain-containing protein [Candidatus Thorarchaeota archaeon]
MISISNDITTRLQALYHSGEVFGYIHSKLPEGTLKTGWIEQGLLSKGMKGQLIDKYNQESLVIPADRFARLTRDMSDSGSTSIAIFGPRGLDNQKFVAIVFGKAKSQSLIAFQIQKQSPLEIIRFLLQYGLGKTVSKRYDEPNLDYVEQLRMDANQRLVNDMLVFSLPKGKAKMSEWIKVALQKGSSDDIVVRHGNSKELSVFSVLLTRWVNGLELFRGMQSAIAACVFVKNEHMVVCLWDSPQRIAAFSSINGIDVEELSRKYLVPMWTAPGDSIQPKREVVLESRVSTSRRKTTPDSKMIRPVDIQDNFESLSTRLDKLPIAKLETRLDDLETQIMTKSGSSSHDKGSFETLQTRLSDNIDRIEILSKRLVELEKRIKKISSSR